MLILLLVKKAHSDQHIFQSFLTMTHSLKMPPTVTVIDVTFGMLQGLFIVIVRLFKGKKC